MSFLKKSDFISYTVGLFFALVVFLTIIQLMTEDYEDVTFFDTKVQVLSYHKNRHGGMHIKVKDENSKEFFVLSVPINCKHLPVNKVVDLSIRKKTKSVWYFIKYNQYMYLGKSPCL